MNKYIIILLVLLSNSLFAKSLDNQYDAQKQLILENIGPSYSHMAKYPVFQYPNTNYEVIADYYPKGKILVFGYGSLMNPASARRSVSASAVESLRPVVTFGMKRIFNYKARRTAHWGSNQDVNEKAMLNIAPTPTLDSMVNGLVMEVDVEELASLVDREKGYDLVPLTIISWDDFITGNPEPKTEVAYAFVASSELRENILYTSTSFYPVRGYLHAVREGSENISEDFLEFFNETTYMADGTTLVKDWDEETFSTLLNEKTY